ncbi:DEAD/DEAH box helicase [Phycisphaerales bacterium AB-hyl4]|uniref:DEAD/DEAH box helicase n=1 Tax=Natronomicrosphaera hydrolytica TaxID=3242702 RepID=A0ABV4U0V3_9BACT
MTEDTKPSTETDTPTENATATDAPAAPNDLFDEKLSFHDLGIRGDVLKGIETAGFTKPTTIQAKLIPVVLDGHDVIGQARTGTGKTAAFGLPIFQKADPDVPGQALILTPTRELAAQVAAELDELGQFTNIRTVCIVGGESMRHQQKGLQGGAHIIVGTPGRVMDLHGRGELKFDNIRFAVLDEVDRMLDIGFRDDIRKILGQIKRDHQTMFVSATISEEIERLGRKFMAADAQRITTVSGSLTVSLVDQKYFAVEPWDKRTLLLHVLRREEPEAVVVFCRTKATVHKITQYLRDKGVNAREIHGDLHQRKRVRVMESLREGNVDVLIASDLAARGLDVDHITHVINYDLPEDPEIYIHRIGRTARAGRKGVAWSFVTPEEGQRLTDVEKHSGALIEKLDYPDFKPGPVPRDVVTERERNAKFAEPVDMAARQAARASTPDTEGLSESELAAMFPGGKVPKNKPRRTLGSRLRTRRS